MGEKTSRPVWSVARKLGVELGALKASTHSEQKYTAVPVGHASETDIIIFYIFQSFGASYEVWKPHLGRTHQIRVDNLVLA